MPVVASATGQPDGSRPAGRGSTVTGVPVQADGPGGRRETNLVGRRAECAELAALLERVRSGESQALVIHGVAGVGKTALLDYVADRGSGCRVARAAGVQSEMELPFAGLHQLCSPMLDRLYRLPGPQRDALATVFGLAPGAAPDLFL